MRPRNDFERELQGYIDNGRITKPTQRQIDNALNIMSRQRRYKYFAFHSHQTINGMKLTKCWKLQRIGKGEEQVFFNLVIVHAERDGKEAWAAKSTGMGFYYCDSFTRDGEVSIKAGESWYGRYLAGTLAMAPAKEMYPYDIVKEKGNNLFVFRDTRIETIDKNGDGCVIDIVMNSYDRMPEYLWQAYKVAHRHGFTFDEGNAWRWMNYIYLVHLNKKDWRNPAVVAPADLVEAHHRINDINDKRIERIAEEKRRAYEEALRKQLDEEKKLREDYAKSHKKWLGIVIVGKGITIKPLQSVEEFEAEGKAMHHCVYSMGYWKKKDTLIMSARDEAGKRLATIEYNLKNNVVVQCRAACNAQPKRYDEIVSLVMNEKRLQRHIA